jgi:hypothetical protein
MESFHGHAKYYTVLQAEGAHEDGFQQNGDDYSHTVYVSSSKSSRRQSLLTHSLTALSTFLITLVLTIIFQRRSTLPERDCVDWFSTWCRQRATQLPRTVSR